MNYIILFEKMSNLVSKFGYLKVAIHFKSIVVNQYLRFYQAFSHRSYSLLLTVDSYFECLRLPDNALVDKFDSLNLEHLVSATFRVTFAITTS